MLNFLIVGAGGLSALRRGTGISLLPLTSAVCSQVNTLIINVVGAFAMGLISAAAKHTGLDGCAVLFLKAGILRRLYHVLDLCAGNGDAV